jgi:nucleotide-binding universal stress UspA family protein
MKIAAILLGIGIKPEASRKWVIQSGIVGERYVVGVCGKNCGRGRFVEARHYLTPWRCQARKFEHKAGAEAFAHTLKRAEGQYIAIKRFEEAWHEEVVDDRWYDTPKIAPTIADHDRPLLELLRLYAEALEAKLRLAHIIPAALPFLGRTKAVEAASPGIAGGVKVGGSCERLHAWRKRLQAAGVPTTTLLIAEGTPANKIVSQTQELGSKVIAIGAQHEHQNDLLGGLLRDPSRQELLRDAPCPVLISETPEVILT